METYDIVLQPTSTFRYTLTEYQQNPPVRGRFYIGEDLWIGNLPAGNVDQILEACTPRGFNFNPAIAQGAHYAVVRQVLGIHSSPRWDEDGILSRVLFISRLVHPTTASSKYSVRMLVENGDVKQIIPGRVIGSHTHIWLVPIEYRDSLTEAEASLLENAYKAYLPKVPDRIRRARGHLDQAFHSFYLDQSIASLVSTVESLLKIEVHNATRQFSMRIHALAAEFGVAISYNEAKTFYSDRSNYVHGAKSDLPAREDETVRVYQLIESSLCKALLQASTDSNFANIFESELSIKSRFG